MANVKLKKKKGESGYEQLYPQTLARNVITGTGNAQTDITNLQDSTITLSNKLNTNYYTKDEVESILNSKGSRSKTVALNGNWVDLESNKSWIGSYGYSTLGYENVFCARLTVEVWLNNYIDSTTSVSTYKNDVSIYRDFVRNTNASDSFSYLYSLELSSSGMTVNLTNTSAISTLKMRIRELKIFY